MASSFLAELRREFNRLCSKDIEGLPTRNFLILDDLFKCNPPPPLSIDFSHIATVYVLDRRQVSAALCT
jgi:hypothetical protein